MLRFMNPLLIMWLLTSCQNSMAELQTDTPQPARIFCDEQVAWSGEIDINGSIDYAIFWIAFEIENASDRFEQVRVEVILDGEAIAEEMKFRSMAEPYQVRCTEDGQQFNAHRLKYTLFLPSLPKGEHTILWTFTMDANANKNNLDIPLTVSREYPITWKVE